MSRFGLSVLIAGIVLASVGIGTMIVGASYNSDPLIFFGGIVFAVGLGLIVVAFYIMIRGIYAKMKEMAEAQRFLAKILEECQVGKKGA